MNPEPSGNRCDLGKPTVRPKGDMREFLCGVCVVGGDEVGEDGGADEEKIEEEPSEETRPMRKMLDPKLPTEEERDDHYKRHLPFRAWCRHCVRGRGNAEPHSKSKDDSEGLPEVHFDYCFPGSKG